MKMNLIQFLNPLMDTKMTNSHMMNVNHLSTK